MNSGTTTDENKRIGDATIARLRQRGLDWELWLDAAVVNGKGIGVAHLYTNPAIAADPNPAIHQWTVPDYVSRIQPRPTNDNSLLLQIARVILQHTAVSHETKLLTQGPRHY